MDAPNIQFYEENTAESQRQLDATASSAFFKFEKNTITYLYILPPWSDRGLPARMVKECYLGKDMGRHVCWHTYELFGHPELGKRDPIVNVLFEAFQAKGKPDEIKRKLPNMRWHVNAIIDGVAKLGPHGEEQDNYEPVLDPKQQIVAFTDALWRDLTKKRNAPGIGNIFHPQAAVCVIVTRDDTTENGITKYSVALAGSKTQGSFTPERTNLFQYWENRGNQAGIPGNGQKVADILQHLNNLEERWPMPAQEAFVECERKAQALKASLLGGVGSAMPGAGTSFGGGRAPVPGGFQPAGGGIAVPGYMPGQAPQSAPVQGIPGTIPGQAPSPQPSQPYAGGQSSQQPAVPPGHTSSVQPPAQHQAPGTAASPGYPQQPSQPQQRTFPAPGSPPNWGGMPPAAPPGFSR